jgi:hypothetical protein
MFLKRAFGHSVENRFEDRRVDRQEERDGLQILSLRVGHASICEGGVTSDSR